MGLCPASGVVVSRDIAQVEVCCWADVNAEVALAQIEEGVEKAVRFARKPKQD
jgi:hypothetical protein